MCIVIHGISKGEKEYEDLHPGRDEDNQIFKKRRSARRTAVWVYRGVKPPREN